jgi:hypothetical protein
VPHISSVGITPKRAFGAPGEVRPLFVTPSSRPHSPRGRGRGFGKTSRHLTTDAGPATHTGAAEPSTVGPLRVRTGADSPVTHERLTRPARTAGAANREIQ